MADNKKYIFTFAITILIFGTALVASNKLNQKKLADVQQVENQVSFNILSSETQFALLGETSCASISPSGFLSDQLGPLGEQLSYTESQDGFNAADVESLKQSYSLLEIKDYLLMKQVTAKCGDKPAFILYFYSNQGDCPDCDKQGEVLTALRQSYPSLRVYSFDYDLDNEAVKTLQKIYGVNGPLPALIVNGDPYYGYHSGNDMLKIPAIKRLAAEYAASSTAAAKTSTSSRCLY
jgi:thiol-disulfide isomerase/thioredoxin